MRPRLFIGSSIEGLSIAYAIQENLEHDATVTIWNQGIFELSSNALDDLIKATDNFDFGVFIFNPDDLTIMRNQATQTVRDNIIFELGLFIGKLGKEKVYFVSPRGIDNFHIPTDLLGITSGQFDPKREDGNLKAALGPFCNQVRDRLKKFLYENINDLVNESKESKKLAIEKPSYWEYLLAGSLLKTRLEAINRKYQDLEKGLVFRPTKNCTISEFISWIADSMRDVGTIHEMLMKTFNEELNKAFGEPGEPGSVLEIKSAIDKTASFLNELLAWEYSLISIIPPEEFEEVKSIMLGWTKTYIDAFNKLQFMIEDAFTPENLQKEGDINITLSVTELPNQARVIEIMNDVVEKVKAGIIDL